MDFTITTPLYYVNDKPHLGSTYTTIACDAIARFHRLEGDNVIFITGVDEHGQKIERSAKKSNKSPQEYCDSITQSYLNLWDRWSITYDSFIRTTSTHHCSLVYEFYQRVSESGDIYLGKQQGWYCVGCEEYKDEGPNEISPSCPIHKTNLEWRNEENLFFRLSKYQKQIEEIVSRPGFIRPQSRRKEINNFVSQGLKDFSISRVNLEWGLPVPGYTGHTFYVWFDALLGYLSALNRNTLPVDLNQLKDKGWPTNVHVIGKDILRFHSVYWPAMLLSAGLDLPNSIFGHGFLTREGQKMGKTIGNILDPLELLNDYGADPIRWYLLKDIEFGVDGDFQQNRFKDLINNDLANTIGNLVNRTTTMSRKWFNNAVPTFTMNSEDTSQLCTDCLATIKCVREAMYDYDLKKSSTAILELAVKSNAFLSASEPWTRIKDIMNKELVAYELYSVLESIRIIGFLLLPLLPDLGMKILNQLGITSIPITWKNNLKWGLLAKGSLLPSPNPIFNKIL